MNSDWESDVKQRLKRRNQLLFTRGSECIEELIKLISLQKHRTVVMWAFLCAENAVAHLKEKYPDDDRPSEAVRMCKLWAEGEIKMPPAKKALLAAHAMAKDIGSTEDIALCHAVGQACATVHVETHAVGLAMYELTAIVRRYGVENCKAAVEHRVSEYVQCMKKCERETENSNGKWASFLLDDSRENKEKLLADKKQAKRNATFKV